MTILKGYHRKENSLKGIVKFEKNEEGKVGLEIPDVLTINNIPEAENSEEQFATAGHLVLETPTAKVLRAKTPEPEEDEEPSN